VRYAIVALVIAASLRAGGAGTLAAGTLAAGPCGTTSVAPATYDHVIWIWMENHHYNDVIGNALAPYTTQLAQQCGTATNYAVVSSPSLPNYIGATAGSTFGITDDNPPSSHVLTADNLFRQVRSAGMTEKSYQESMAGNCALTSSGSYAVKHNPAAYFAGGSDRPACQADDVPMGTTSSGNFLTDVSNDTLPNFAFITPDLCSDTHDCPVNTGDLWLQAWLPLIFNSSAYLSGNTAVIIMWDEPTPMPNVFITPSTAPGTVSGVAFNHYSLLRTTEEMLGDWIAVGG
jgi:phospholipase C